MRIYLKKFGTTLTSRSDGKEALLAIRPTLAGLPENETIEIDFDGVVTFAPSWGDEFLTPFAKQYHERLTLLHTENPSVVMTVSLLEKVNGFLFKKT